MDKCFSLSCQQTSPESGTVVELEDFDGDPEGETGESGNQVEIQIEDPARRGNSRKSVSFASPVSGGEIKGAKPENDANTTQTVSLRE